MAIYLYKHPDTGEIIEVVQSMNDVHEFSQDGIQYERIFTVPKASIDTNINPFSSKDFVSKTNKKGTVGNLWDLSNEMSSKRVEKEGFDRFGGAKKATEKEFVI